MVVTVAGTFLLVIVGVLWALRRPSIQNAHTLWFGVDCLWLATAGLALLIGLTELTRMRNQAAIDAAEGEVRSARATALAASRWAADFSHWVDPSLPGADWFVRMRDAIESGFDSPDARRFLTANTELMGNPPAPGQSRVPEFPDWEHFRFQPTQAIPREIAIGILRDLETMESAERIVRELPSPKYRSSYEVLLRDLSPWVLTVALALRFGKSLRDY